MRAYGSWARAVRPRKEGLTHDRFRIDRGVTRHATRCDRDGVESDGRTSTPQSGKDRAFDHEIRPILRNRCALLITLLIKDAFIRQSAELRMVVAPLAVGKMMPMP